MPESEETTAKTSMQRQRKAKNPEYVSLVVHPERDKSVGGFPHTGGIRFPMPARPAIEGRTTLSMTGQLLSPGHQIVSWEEYRMMEKNPFWPQFVKKGVIQVVLPRPDAEKLTRTTLDYEPEAAFELIAESQDVDWLKLCLSKDDREGIAEVCQQQITEIEESTRPREVA